LEKVTELLDRCVFYLIPTINPDGRDRWFHRAQTASSSRSGASPVDSDRDGTATKTMWMTWTVTARSRP
jgi:murein tripeptide amidase MpaA